MALGAADLFELTQIWLVDEGAVLAEADLWIRCAIKREVGVKRNGCCAGLIGKNGCGWADNEEGCKGCGNELFHGLVPFGWLGFSGVDKVEISLGAD